MKNVISFSLWGDNPIYTVGAIRNSELKNEFFPDWEMWIYYDVTVKDEILNELNNNGVKLIEKSDEAYIKATWRFLPISDNSIDYFISRDCDSRISLRDKISVNEWLSSGKDYHIVRDHPVGHSWKMNAGMWGAKGGLIPNIEQLIHEYKHKSTPYVKEFDQYFLTELVYPKTSNSLFCHDEYFNYEGFCKSINRDRKIDDFAFIGESIGTQDESRFEREYGEQRRTVINKYNEKI